MTSIHSYYIELNKELMKHQDTNDEMLYVQHNRALMRFFADSVDITEELLRIHRNIKEKCGKGSKNPIHPSWNLVSYHLALWFFQRCQIDKTLSILDDLWNGLSDIEEFLQLLICLLSIEVFSYQPNLCRSYGFYQLACNFVTSKVKGNDYYINLAKKRLQNYPFLNQVIERILNAHVRLHFAYLVSSVDDNAKETIASDFQKSFVVSELKSKGLSETKAGVILSVLIYVQENERFKTVLDMVSDHTSTFYMNNNGVFNFIKQKYCSALFEFSKITESKDVFCVFHPYQQTLYNIGISLLFKKRPKKAFIVLSKLSSVMPKHAYIWLRMAECCVMFYNQKVTKLRKQYPLKFYSTATRSIAVLPISDYKNFCQHYGKKQLNLPSLSLEYAEVCVRKAIENATEKQNNVKTSATYIGSYICLELGKWDAASVYAKNVWSEKSNDRNWRFATRLYSAQASMMMRQSPSENLNSLLFESQNQSKNNLSMMYTSTVARSYIYESSYEKINSPTFLNLLKKDPKCLETYLTRAVCILKSQGPHEAFASLKEYSKPE